MKRILWLIIGLTLLLSLWLCGQSFTLNHVEMVAQGGAAAAAAPVESLWSDPILQQVAVDSSNYEIGATSANKASQKVHNTDSDAVTITKVRVYFRETSGAGGDVTITVDLRTNVNGGGTSYGTLTGTLPQGATQWVDCTGSVEIPASTDFFIDTWASTANNRVYKTAADTYEGNTYYFYINGAGNNYYDLTFEIYITE